MSILDKINFTIPSFTADTAIKWLKRLPKDSAEQVAWYHSLFKIGYVYAYFTGKQKCFSQSFGGTDIVMQKVKDFLGVKQLPLPVATADILITNGCFEVIDKPYASITGKAAERVLPISPKEMKKLDKLMDKRPIDVDKDGEPEISGSLLRIDSDNKPEEFHIHYNEPKKTMVTETFLEIPTALKVKTSIEIYITPSQNPNKTIKITVPLSIHVYVDL